MWADRAYLEMGVLPDLERRANTGFSGRGGLPPFCGARPILSLNYRHLPAAVPGDFWGIARPLQNGCKRRWEGGGIQRTAEGERREYGSRRERQIALIVFAAICIIAMAFIFLWPRFGSRSYVFAVVGDNQGGGTKSGMS